MGIIAKLKHAGKTLDLVSAPYTIGRDFMPPSLNMSINWAEGTSTNRGGAVNKGTRYQDRAWSFAVRVMGSSETEVMRHVRRLEEWLSVAGDEDNPLQFAYAPSDAIPFEPLYGQSWKYYTIKSGYCSGAIYAPPTLGISAVVVMNLVVGPYAEGRTQRLFNAIGGIYDDYIGVPGKRARGVIVPEGTTNKFLNPIFCNGTAYDNGWTSTDLTDLRNSDLQYIIMGDYSTELTMIAATAQFTESVNVGNVNTHVLSFYAKKIDGSAVTASDCKVYYGADKDSTYQSVGDGWYRVYASFAGINAATASGVALQTIGGTLYVDGFQLEEKAYPTSLAVGDMPGCVWTTATTPHASTSTRTAGQMICPTGSKNILYQSSPYSIRMVAKWQHDHTFGADRYLFDATTLECYHESADDKIYITDGTNTVSTAALTWSALDEIVYHWVFDAGKIELYINGAVTGAVGAAFVPTSAASGFYIGSTTAGAAQLNATVMDFTTWDRALTAAQILADYNNIEDWINDDGAGNPLTPPAWIWSIDTNYYSYNYDDATHRTYAVAGSIPGSLPALSIMDIVITGNDLVLSNLPVDYIYPCNPYIYFMDCQGTVVAGRLNGEVLRTSIDTAETAISTSYDIPSRYAKVLTNKNATFYLVTADAGSNLLARGGIYQGSNYLGYTDYGSLAADATYRNFMLPTMVYPYIRKDDITNLSSIDSRPILIIRFKRSSGAAANVDLDYWMVFFGAVAYMPITVANTSVGIISDGKIELHQAGAPSSFAGYGEYRGDIIEFEPGKINYLSMLNGPLAGANDYANHWTILTNIYIIPRWGLL